MRAVCLVVALLGSAHADTTDDAQKLYAQGRLAYEREEYQAAYELFRRAFILSSEPAFLFNMASVQQKLRRPHDAAESLRAYLRASPNDPETPAIERRIRGLEEQQRMLDDERRLSPSPQPEISPRVAPTSSALLTSSPPPPRSRRGLIIGLSVAGAALVAISVGVALGVTLGSSVEYTPSPLGEHPGTR